MLAHEVRSPVAAIVAIAAAYPSSNGARRKRLRELAAGAASSIERLLAEAPTSAPLERVDVGRLVRDVAETAALGSTPVIAETETGLRIEGDRDRLRQALDNLIGNAVGHSPDGCAVTVIAQRRGMAVVISVADEGEGIAPDDVARVFEPGVRLTTARPGSGLGLALVLEIAREHGGDVEVDSSPGEGSTFKLVLPVASAAG